MELNQIIKRVTVDCKDNGRFFTDESRIHAIQDILSNTDYELLHNGRLCYIYGKSTIRNQPVILISSHIDCVFNHLFCKHLQEQHIWEGTFDNSITNACVLYDMLHGKFESNVVIAFTGDEEEDSGGVYEVIRVLHSWNVNVSLAIVLDVTEEGWKQQHHFTVENDLGVDILTGHLIVETLEKYKEHYGFIHDSEPDESYDYDEEDVPCFSLCIPCCGDMHSDNGVQIREESLPTYCEVLSDLANLSEKNPTILDKVYYLDYEERNNHIKLYGIYSDEKKCKKDEYMAIKEHNGQIQLPSMIHGKRVMEIADFCMMGAENITVRSLIIPETYQSLGKKNFSGWKCLEEVVLCCDESAMCEWNFAYCDNLRIVICNNTSIFNYCKRLPLEHSALTYGCFDRCLDHIQFMLV